MCNLESIEIQELGNVFGGKSTMETVCRGAGGLVGGVLGAGANVTGIMAETAAGMAAGAVASVGAGIVNARSASSYREFDNDITIGLVGAVPIVGLPMAVVAGGRLGSKAGGAACGYGWKSRG
jgi:hypothetical protein